MRRGKYKRPVRDLADEGKFVCPVGEVRWKCWLIDDPMTRRRIEGPKSVTAHTAFFARQFASLEHFDGCDPLHVDVEQEP